MPRTPSPRPPTMADIARELGVSAASVSLALRNDSRVAEDTRERIREAALRLGYRHDPNLGKLMHHLRQRRENPFQGTIVALQFACYRSHYSQRILGAAKARSEELGYQLVSEAVRLAPEELPRHERSLRQRNVEGLLFLPSECPLNLSHHYDWNHFALIATGYSPLTPQMDRITADWFHSIRNSVAELSRRGFQRPGFIIGAQFDMMVNHYASAAVAEQMLLSRGQALRPFFYLPELELKDQAPYCQEFHDLISRRCSERHPSPLPQMLSKELLDWYAREKPDILIVNREESMLTLGRFLQEKLDEMPELVTLSLSHVVGYAGVRQNAELIGRLAIDALNEQITRGTRGPRPHPVSQLIQGQWISTPTLSMDGLA